MIDATTVVTRLGAWIEAIYQSNELAFDAGNMFENAHKLRSGKVANLAPPKCLHPLHGQVLKEKCVIAVGQLMCKLKEPVTPTINDCLIKSSDVLFGFLPVVRPLALTRHCPLRKLQIVHGLAIVQWAFDLLSVRRCEEDFHAKVETCAVTCQDSGALVDLFLDNEVQIEIAQRITLYRYSFDIGGDVTRLTELVHLATDYNLVAVKQFPACLLKRETAVLFYLLEAWRTGANLALEIAEEKFVRLVNAVANILNGLGIDKIPMRIAVKLFQLGDVFHQDKLIQALASQAKVPSMQRNAVVINQPRNVNLLVQVLILFRAIQLEFVCLDDLH